MYAVSVEELRAQGREIVAPGGMSRLVRFILAADELGFSLSDVRLKAGRESTLWYKNHWEANYVVAGAGTVTDLATGTVLNLHAGLCYVVGPKDRHVLKATADLHIVSIFNPPLTGAETRNPDGSLPATAPPPPGPAHQR